MRRLASIAILCVAPGVAAADGLVIPGLEDPGPRPSYRESYGDYPPPQHDILGMPTRTPSPWDRPSYRQSYNDFPPAAGRYGGGFVEYLMTGGRMGPTAAPAAPGYAPLYPPAVPAYEATAPRRRLSRSGLPRSGLPDYLPDQPAAAVAKTSPRG